METQYLNDPERDPQLAAALRAPGAELGDADFARLRGAINARAELPLARLRHAPASRRAWRLRALVPLAAAAGIAGALALGVLPPREQGTLSARDQAQVEQILDASTPPVVDELVSAQAGSEQLLSAAIGS